MLFVLVIVAQDLTVDERGKHLRLQEVGEERQVRFGLIRQEGGLQWAEFRNGKTMKLLWATKSISITKRLNYSKVKFFRII